MCRRFLPGHTTELTARQRRAGHRLVPGSRGAIHDRLVCHAVGSRATFCVKQLYMSARLGYSATFPYTDGLAGMGESMTCCTTRFLPRASSWKWIM